MTKYTMPSSVQDYLSNAQTRNAVDSLLPLLDGKTIPEGLGTTEARQFNTALLSAAQVRHDFVDMLYEMWDLTFGEAIQGLNGIDPKFFSAEHSVQSIWNGGNVSKVIPRHGIDYECCAVLEHEGRDAGIYLAIYQLTKAGSYQSMSRDRMPTMLSESWHDAGTGEEAHIETARIPHGGRIAGDLDLSPLCSAANVFLTATE